MFSSRCHEDIEQLITELLPQSPSCTESLSFN